MKNILKKFDEKFDFDSIKPNTYRSRAVKSFITQQITELLMDMPLEEKDSKYGNYLIEGGYNKAIKELKDWRDNILKNK